MSHGDDSTNAPSTPQPAALIALAAESLRRSGHLRLRVRGQSMLPTLWPDDIVEIASCSVDDVRSGEIVLAVREDRFFLHRFLRRTQTNGFLLRADSMRGPDPQFPNDALLGRLVSRTGQNQNRAQSRGHRDALEQNRPLLPLRPWSRAIGQLLCHCGLARGLVLKLHGCRELGTREMQNANSAAHFANLDGDAS
jgi:hypothetical protein